MSRVFQILFQTTITLSVVASVQNLGSAINIRQPFSVAMCEQLCKNIRECSSSSFKQRFLRCLLLKVTGMSDMTIFQLSTWNCHPSATHPKTRENRMRGYRCQEKGTVNRSENTECKRHGYRSVRVGRDMIHVKLHTEHQTWDQALAICHSEKATLAVPNTKEKEDAMMKLNIDGAVEDVWIGLRDFGENDTFVWMNGSPLSYTNWFKEEPTHVYKGVDQNCVGVSCLAWLHTCNWNDLSCENNKRSFICQCF